MSTSFKDKPVSQSFIAVTSTDLCLQIHPTHKVNVRVFDWTSAFKRDHGDG